MVLPVNKTLAAINRLMRGAVNQQIQHLNIRAAQSDLLLYISDHPDLLQKDIARATCMDASLLARDLRTLSQRGWVLRTPDLDDQRARRVRLTPEGVAVAAQLKDLAQGWWRTFAASHPEVDLETFAALANDVFQALREGDRYA